MYCLIKTLCVIKSQYGKSQHQILTVKIIQMIILLTETLEQVIE